MIVTAALIWWNEPPDVLERCVRGIATIADRIVAVDGAYRRYPGATSRSSVEQEETIRDVAQEEGLEVDIVIPGELWDGQVAKRTYALQRAAEGSDWVAQVDADWVASGDREAVRNELGKVRQHVVNVRLCTPSADVDFGTNWHRRESGRCVRHPHLFRALPGTQVEERHWWISALHKGTRVWLHHPVRRAKRPVMPQWQLRADYRIDHLFTERSEAQVLAGRAFCNDRNLVMRLTGQEDHIDGLPDPVFDYDTIPY